MVHLRRNGKPSSPPHLFGQRPLSQSWFDDDYGAVCPRFLPDRPARTRQLTMRVRVGLDTFSSGRQAHYFRTLAGPASEGEGPRCCGRLRAYVRPACDPALDPLKSPSAAHSIVSTRSLYAALAPLSARRYGNPSAQVAPAGCRQA